VSTNSTELEVGWQWGVELCRSPKFRATAYGSRWSFVNNRPDFEAWVCTVSDCFVRRANEMEGDHGGQVAKFMRCCGDTSAVIRPAVRGSRWCRLFARFPHQGRSTGCRLSHSRYPIHLVCTIRRHRWRSMTGEGLSDLEAELATATGGDVLAEPAECQQSEPSG